MLALCKCVFIIIATIPDNDKYYPEYSSELHQKYCMLKKYAQHGKLKLSKHQQMGMLTWMKHSLVILT